DARVVQMGQWALLLPLDRAGSAAPLSLAMHGLLHPHHRIELPVPMQAAAHRRGLPGQEPLALVDGNLAQVVSLHQPGDSWETGPTSCRAMRAAKRALASTSA